MLMAKPRGERESKNMEMGEAAQEERVCVF